MRTHGNVARRLAPMLLIMSAGATMLGASETQNRAAQERQREQWQRVSDIFRAMDVRPGAVVADIGAGGGFFTTRLAAAVGTSGHVFAVDIDDAQLDRLRRRLSEEAHRNVTVGKGTATDPGLAEGTLDAALIVNAYHEMAEHQAMLAAIRKALKPAGRLVIVEPISERRRVSTREEQTRGHEIALEFALQDLRAAGYRIIGLEDPFTTHGKAVEWMVTATPMTAPPPAAPLPASAAADDWENPAHRISLEQFDRLAASGAGTVIDVRDEGMFTKGHIPNAVLIPLQNLEAAADRVRGMKRPLITYCS